jgi:TonB family protein
VPEFFRKRPENAGFESRRPDAGVPESIPKGKIVVEIVVSHTGAVLSAKVAKGIHEKCDAAALAAVRKWKDRAATRDGKPVEAPLKVTRTISMK